LVSLILIRRWKGWRSWSPGSLLFVRCRFALHRCPSWGWIFQFGATDFDFLDLFGLGLVLGF
jgi:hypothetical protein